MKTKLLELKEKVLSNQELSKDEQGALSEHSQEAELLEVYVRKRCFYEKAQVKMLQQKEAKELFQIYVKRLS